MSPGAGERNVEVITAKLGGKASMTRGTGCAIDRDPVAVGAILAQESSSRARRIVPLVAPLAVNQQTHRGLSFCGLRALPSMRRRGCHISRCNVSLVNLAPAGTSNNKLIHARSMFGFDFR